MKNKSVIMVGVFALILGLITLFCWFKPHTAYSESERRPLAEKPELTVETLTNGEFMSEFEEYTVDQFPARDTFRKIKALFATYIFNKKDNNGLFVADGHISKLEYPVNEQMVEHAQERFDFIYKKYLKDKNTNIYLSIVPDKNYFIAEKNGYPAIDYKEFIDDFKNRVDYMEYIDILPQLSIDDYYRTDSHWKQENIQDIAIALGKGMGTDVKTEYEVKTLDKPFAGVYLGQSALPFEADTIKYLTNEILESFRVNYFDTGVAVPGEVYNMEKAHSKDPYEMFLSGTAALIEIENPDSESDKELVIFRDSYGSSIAPLLAVGYKKTTVVDTRYLQSDFLGNFIEFDNKDVLFLYSTTLLNNSMAIR